MPANTVKVDRTTKWGNPYKEGITPGNYASWFREDVTKEMASEQPTEDHPWSRHLHFIAHNLKVLKGVNLACWCPLDQPCHADVLLELANAPYLVEGEMSKIVEAEQPIPCQFCDSDPIAKQISVHYRTARRTGVHPMVRMACLFCGAIGKCRPTTGGAIASWNEPWQALVADPTTPTTERGERV